MCCFALFWSGYFSPWVIELLIFNSKLEYEKKSKLNQQATAEEKKEQTCDIFVCLLCGWSRLIFSPSPAPLLLSHCMFIALLIVSIHCNRFSSSSSCNHRCCCWCFHSILILMFFSFHFGLIFCCVAATLNRHQIKCISLIVTVKHVNCNSGCTADNQQQSRQAATKKKAKKLSANC